MKPTILCLLTLMTAAMMSGCQAQSSNESASLADASATEQLQNDTVNASAPLALSDMLELMAYENAENGFSMAYPADWTAQDAEPNDQGMVAGFLAPGEDMNNPVTYLLVQIEALPSGQSVTLEQYSQAVINYLKDVAPTIKILTEGDISIAGHSGHAIVYNLESDNAAFRVLKAWTLIGDKAYAFTYNAPDDRYEEFAGDISKMIASLKVN